MNRVQGTAHPIELHPADKAELLFETILGDPVDEFGHYNTLLACGCLGEMVNYKPACEDGCIGALREITKGFLTYLAHTDKFFQLVASLELQKNKS